MAHPGKILNYPKRITLFNSTHMTSVVDYVTSGMLTPMVDSEWSLEKDFMELII